MANETAKSDLLAGKAADAMDSTKPRPLASKITETIGNLRFLIDGRVTKRDIPAKGDRPARVLYQQAAVIVGGDRQINWSTGTMDESGVLPEGCYVLGKNCLALGDFDRLEVKSRPENFVFLRALKPAEKELFTAWQTDIDDLVG